MGCAVCAILRDGKKGEFILKQTGNYQLNQWEKFDRIMMEDFNADNAKIDAAISSEANRVADLPHGELICGGNTETDTTRLDLDVSQVDWSRYWAVFLELDPPDRVLILNLQAYDRGGSYGKAYCAVGNGNGNIYPGYLAQMDTYRDIHTGNSAIWHVLFPVFYNAGMQVSALGVGVSLSSGYSSITYGQLGKLSIVGHQGDWITPAGTAFKLWGVR